jgi:hypothetical protein
VPVKRQGGSTNTEMVALSGTYNNKAKWGMAGAGTFVKYLE